jgi:hypothetical protein
MSGFRFPVFFSALGRSLAAAATQAAAKALLGIVDFDPAEPGPIGETTPATGRFSSIVTGGILVSAPNSYQQKVSGISGSLIDRLALINRRGTVTATNITNPNNAFDQNGGTFASIPLSQSGIFEIYLPPPLMSFSGGTVFGVSSGMASISVELFTGTDEAPAWTSYPATIKQVVPNSTAQDFEIALPFQSWSVSSGGRRLRITFNAAATAGSLSTARVWLMSYFPARPGIGEIQQFLPLGHAVAVNVDTPALQVVDGPAIGALKPNSVEILSTTGATRWRIQVNDSGVISATSI